MADFGPPANFGGTRKPTTSGGGFLPPAPTGAAGGGPVANPSSLIGLRGQLNDPPSLWRQAQSASSGMVRGLFVDLPEALGRESWNVAKHSYETIRDGNYASNVGKPGITFSQARNDGKGIEESMHAVVDENLESNPFSAPMTKSVLTTGGRLANPSRYKKASDEGTIVSALLEDAGNVSLVTGPVAKTFTATASRAATAESAARTAAQAAAKEAAKASDDAFRAETAARSAFTPAAAAEAASARTAARTLSAEAERLAKAAEAAKTEATFTARQAAVVEGVHQAVNRAGMAPFAAPVWGYRGAKGAGRLAAVGANVGDRHIPGVAETVGRAGLAVADRAKEGSKLGTAAAAVGTAGEHVAEKVRTAPERAARKAEFRDGIWRRFKNQEAVEAERAAVHMIRAGQAIGAAMDSPRQQAAHMMSVSKEADTWVAALAKAAKKLEDTGLSPDDALAQMAPAIEHAAKQAAAGTGYTPEAVVMVIDALNGRNPELAEAAIKYGEEFQKATAGAAELHRNAVGRTAGPVSELERVDTSSETWQDKVAWDEKGTTPHRASLEKIQSETQRLIDDEVKVAEAAAEAHRKLTEKGGRISNRDLSTLADTFGETNAALLTHAKALLEDRPVAVLRSVGDKTINSILDRMESAKLSYDDGIGHLADRLGSLAKAERRKPNPRFASLFDGAPKSLFGERAVTPRGVTAAARDADRAAGAASDAARVALREAGVAARTVDRLDATMAERIAADIAKVREGLAREVERRKAALEKAWAKQTPDKRDPTGKTPSKAYRLGAADAAKVTRIYEAHKAALRAYKVSRAQLLKLDAESAEKIAAKAEAALDKARTQAQRAADKAAAAEAKATKLSLAADVKHQAFVAEVAAIAMRRGVDAGKLEQRIYDVARDMGISKRRIERLKARQLDLLAKAADDVMNAPARYRAVLNRGRAVAQDLRDLALDMNLDPVLREVLAEAADEIPLTLKAMVDAGIDPQFVIGGRSTIGLVSAVTGEPIEVGGQGKGGSITTPQMGLGRKLQSVFKNRGTNAEVAIRPTADRYRADFVKRFDNEINFAVNERWGSTPRKLFLKNWRDHSGSLDEAEQKVAQWEQGGISGTEAAQILKDYGYEGWDVGRGKGQTTEQIGLDTPALPNDIIQSWRRTAGDLTGVDHWFGWIDRPTRWWKNFALALSPRWQVNNIGGNTLMATAAGIDLATFPTYLRRAWLVLSDDPAKRAKAAEAMGDNARFLVEGEMARPEVLGKGFGPMDLVDNFDVKAAKAKGVRGALRHPITTGYKLNGMVDDLFRTTLFLQNIDNITALDKAKFVKKNPWAKSIPDDELAVTMATSDALRILGDFQTLTRVERSIIKRIIPFYPWMRHILTLSANLAADNPARLVLMLRLGELYSEPNDTGLPWLDTSIPLGDKEDELYLKLPPALNPFGDVLRTAGMSEDQPFPMALPGAMNPLAKEAVAQLVGYDINEMAPLARAEGTGRHDLFFNQTGTPLLRQGKWGLAESLYHLGQLTPQTRALMQIGEAATRDGKRYSRYPTGQQKAGSVDGKLVPYETGRAPYGPYLNPVLSWLGLPQAQYEPVKEMTDAQKAAQVRWETARRKRSELMNP